MSSIMFQGTASNVGKSVVVCGICRVLTQDGYNVVPFKPQNMSLNSYIDVDGREMGRAQVFQAVACNKIPRAYMNPILLKPCGNHVSQVIFNGEVVGNMESSKYQEYKKELLEPLRVLFDSLERNHDVVVMEGAGSPAEININSLDISNMKMAEISDSPVVLVADIDRGGVFASIVGTLMLLKKEYRDRIKGVIINKFRGNKSYFESGVKMLEDIIKIPVLGVIPYFDIKIDEEDGVSSKFIRNGYLSYSKDKIIIDVIKYPHMSNYTDFEVFEYLDDVVVNYIDTRYINNGCIEINSDILILPGSKDTISDLDSLKESGIFDAICDYVKKGGILVGICGGYQMLGRYIIDKEGIDSGVDVLEEVKSDISKLKVIESDINKRDEVESDINKLKVIESDINKLEEVDDRLCFSSGFVREGFSFIDMDTIFSREKITCQTEGVFSDESGVFSGLCGMTIKGYELHMGREVITGDGFDDNIYVLNGRVLGTYVHGFFDNIEMTARLLNNIRKEKGIGEKVLPTKTLDELKIIEYDKLANIIRDSIDMDKIYDIIFKFQGCN